MKNFSCIIFLSSLTAAAADTNEIAALIPAYAEIPPTFWEQHGTLVVIGAFVVLAVAAAVIWEIFRPKPAPVLPPETVARAALAKLENQPEDGELLSEVSQILRRYLGAVFEIPGGELTTTECCAAISHHEKIRAELAATISSFLRECDKSKFSAAISSTPINAVARAQEIISLAERQRAQSQPLLKNSHP